MSNSTHYILITFAFCLVLHIQAQEKKEISAPVSDPFYSSMLIDNQTTMTPYAQGKEFIIHHRFGKIEDIDDLYGLYGSSNIRLGFNYGITDKIMVGIGTERYNKIQDVHLKYRFLDQTEENEIPFTVAYYVNMALDASNKQKYGVNYKFSNRLSYFHELILSRKFSERISAFVAPNFSHFNMVDSTMNNDVLGISYGGRCVVYNMISFLFEGNYQITKPDVDPPKQSMNAGVEFATGTHAFQVFIASFDQITPQRNYVYNQNDLWEGELLFGFNITVRF